VKPTTASRIKPLRRVAGTGGAAMLTTGP
jgi:hypothetical protein